MKHTKDSCKCSLCQKIERDKWTDISKCQCICHQDGQVAHSRLCCPYPNVLKDTTHENFDNCPNCGAPFNVSPLGEDGLYCELCQPEL